MKRMQRKVTVEINGRKIRKSINGYSRKELDRKEKELLAQIESEKSPTFLKCSEAWSEAHFKEIEIYTAECYKAPLADLRAEFGHRKIIDITPMEIQRFLNVMARQQYARQTVRLRLNVMNMICDYAVLHGTLKYNPCSSVKVPKTRPPKKVESPEPDDLRKVVESVDEKFGDYAFLLMHTGLRRGELLALKYEDVYDGYIHINKVVVYDNGRPVVREYTKSMSGMRQIPVLSPAERFLTGGKGFIFHEPDGSPLTLSHVNSYWNSYRIATGLEITQHQLRHAFATICYDAGLDVKDTQTIMGHSRESVTMDIYTSITATRKEDAKKKLEAYIAG